MGIALIDGIYCFLSLNEWGQANLPVAVIFSFHGRKARDDGDALVIIMALVTSAVVTMVYEGLGLELAVMQASFINIEDACQVLPAEICGSCLRWSSMLS